MNTLSTPIWNAAKLWQIVYSPNPHPPVDLQGRYDDKADKHKSYLVTRDGVRGKRFKYLRDLKVHDAKDECAKRNFKDNGIRVAPYNDHSDRYLPVHDSQGEFIAHINEYPFSYTFLELHDLPTIESKQTSNLKERTDRYSVHLDRMSIADYRNYCDDRKVIAAGFLPSRLVWVWDSHGVLVALYLATDVDDGFMDYRQQILKDELEAAAE